MDVTQTEGSAAIGRPWEGRKGGRNVIKWKPNVRPVHMLAMHRLRFWGWRDLFHRVVTAHASKQARNKRPSVAAAQSALIAILVRSFVVGGIFGPPHPVNNGHWQHTFGCRRNIPPQKEVELKKINKTERLKRSISLKHCTVVSTFLGGLKCCYAFVST
jgi:hypothetical protein